MAPQPKTGGSGGQRPPAKNGKKIEIIINNELLNFVVDGFAQKNKIDTAISRTKTIENEVTKR